jgi:hypothetical protein
MQVPSAGLSLKTKKRRLEIASFGMGGFREQKPCDVDVFIERLSRVHAP